jgi:PAS domain S-box-containing protein
MQFDALQFFDHSSEAFCVLEPSWCFAFVNQNATKLFGLDAENLIGKKIWDLYSADAYNFVKAQLERVIAEQISVEFSAEFITEGSWFSLKAFPAGDGVAFFVNDVSDVRKIETVRANQESYFKSLLNSTGEGIFALDLDGNCTFLNHAGAAMLGFTPKEVLGRSMHSLTHHTRSDGTPYPREQCHIYRAFHDDIDVKVNDELLWRKDGSSFTAEYMSYPVKLNGVTRGAVVAFSDITERKATEIALKESEERFRSLVTTTAQIVWTTGADGQFISEQREWTKFTGQSTEDAHGWGWFEAVHPEDRDGAKSSWMVALDKKMTYQQELRVRRQDSAYRYMLVRAVPILNADGAVREWVGIHTDITERKSAELERERLLQSERKSRAEADELKHRALSLAGELAIERDKIGEANQKLQTTVDELETATALLREKQEHQALVTRFLRGANKVAAQSTGTDSLIEKFKSLVLTLRNDFRMAVAGVWIAEPSGHMLLLAAEIGLTEAPTRSLEPRIDINMHSYKLGWVARLKRPHVTHDLVNDIQMDQNWVTEHKMVYAAFFPLLDRDRLLGVIAAFSRYELPLEGADIIGTMATVLASTIQTDSDEREGREIREVSSGAEAKSDTDRSSVEV